MQPRSCAQERRARTAWGYLQRCKDGEDRPTAPPIGLTKDLIVLGRGAEPPPGAARSLIGARCPLQWLSTDDERISRLHASITAHWQQGRCHPLVSIEDHSRNGTFLNGVPLQPGRSIVLSHGDRISLVLSVNPLAEVSYIYEEAAPAALGAAAEQRLQQWASSPASGDSLNSPAERLYDDSLYGRDGCRRSLIYGRDYVAPLVPTVAALHERLTSGVDGGNGGGVPACGTTAAGSSSPPPPPPPEAPRSPDRRRLSRACSAAGEAPVTDIAGGSSASGIRRRSRRVPPTEPLRRSGGGAGGASCRNSAAGYASPDENVDFSDDAVESPTTTPRSCRTQVLQGCTISPVRPVDAVTTDALAAAAAASQPLVAATPRDRGSASVSSPAPHRGSQRGENWPSPSPASPHTHLPGSPHSTASPSVRPHGQQLQPPASPARSPGPARCLATANSVPLPPPPPPLSPRARPPRPSAAGQFSPGGQSTASTGTRRARRPSRLLQVSTPESLPPGVFSEGASSCGSFTLMPPTTTAAAAPHKQHEQNRRQQNRRAATYGGVVDAPKLAAALADSLQLRQIDLTRRPAGASGTQGNGGDSSDASQEEDVQEFSFSTVLRPQVQPPAPTPPPSCADGFVCTAATRPGVGLATAAAEADRAADIGSCNSSSSGNENGQSQNNTSTGSSGDHQTSWSGLSMGTSLGCPASPLRSIARSPGSSSAAEGGSRAVATAASVGSSSSSSSRWPAMAPAGPRGFSSGSAASLSPDCSPDSPGDQLLLHPEVVLRNRHPNRRHTRYGESMDTPSSYSPQSVSLRRHLLLEPGTSEGAAAVACWPGGGFEPVQDEQDKLQQVPDEDQKTQQEMCRPVQGPTNTWQPQQITEDRAAVGGSPSTSRTASTPPHPGSSAAEHRHTVADGTTAVNADYTCPYLPYTPITLLQPLDARVGDAQQYGTPPQPVDPVSRHCDWGLEGGSWSVCGSSGTGGRICSGGTRNQGNGGQTANEAGSSCRAMAPGGGSVSGCGDWQQGCSDSGNAAASTHTSSSGGASSGFSRVGTPLRAPGRHATAVSATATTTSALWAQRGSASIPENLSSLGEGHPHGARRYGRANSAGGLGSGYSFGGHAWQQQQQQPWRRRRPQQHHHYQDCERPISERREDLRLYDITGRHGVSRSAPDTRVLVCHSEGRLRGAGPYPLSPPSDLRDISERFGSRHSDSLQAGAAGGVDCLDGPCRSRFDEVERRGGHEEEKGDEVAVAAPPPGSSGLPRTLALMVRARSDSLGRQTDFGDGGDKSAAEVPGTSRYPASTGSDELLCGLCGDYLRRAIAVQPCGHSYCGSCLSQHFATAIAAGAKLCCPEGCIGFVQLAVNKPARRLEELMLSFPGLGNTSPMQENGDGGYGGRRATGGRAATLSRPAAAAAAGYPGYVPPLAVASAALSRAADCGRAASDPGPRGGSAASTNASSAAAPSRLEGGGGAAAARSSAAGAPDAPGTGSPAPLPCRQSSPISSPPLSALSPAHQRQWDSSGGGDAMQSCQVEEGSSPATRDGGGGDCGAQDELRSEADVMVDPRCRTAFEAPELCPLPDEALPMSATRLHVRQAEHLLLRLREVLELRPEPPPAEAARCCLALLSPLTRLAATYPEAREALSAMGALQGCLLVMEQQLRMELQREREEILQRLGVPEQRQQQLLQSPTTQEEQQQQLQPQQQAHDRPRSGHDPACVEIDPRISESVRVRHQDLGDVASAATGTAVGRADHRDGGVLGPGATPPLQPNPEAAAPGACDAARGSLEVQRCACGLMGVMLRPVGSEDGCQQSNQWALARLGGVEVLLRLLRRALAAAAACAGPMAEAEVGGISEPRVEQRQLRRVRQEAKLLAISALTVLRLLVAGNTMTQAHVAYEGAKAVVAVIRDMSYSEGVKTAGLQLLAELAQGDDATHAAIRLRLVEEGVIRLAVEAFGGSIIGGSCKAQADVPCAGRGPLLAASIPALGTLFAAAMPRALRAAAVSELRRLRVLPRLRSCLRALELEAAERSQGASGSRRTTRHAAAGVGTGVIEANDGLLASGRRLERRLEGVLSAMAWWRAGGDEEEEDANRGRAVELSWRGLAAAVGAGFAVGATVTAAIVAALM